MSADVFISYAWTSEMHREWVRLLASHLHNLGYDVKIDEAVDYGSSLSGFMRDVVEAKHVLLVVDENYVDRADHRPNSGVGVETKWISGVYADRPATWLAVLWVHNPGRSLPSWLDDLDPKGFDFNARPDTDDFPGANQLNEIWRWIEGLPASTAHSVPLAEIRRRAARIERVELLGDPGHYTSPSLNGRVTFRHGDHSHYRIGHDEYEFKVQFGDRSTDGVYVYKDAGLKALGLITDKIYDRTRVERFLSPGRTVQPRVGQSVVLLNSAGALCIVTIDDVQHEVNGELYVPGHVTFTWEVLAP